MYTSADKSQPGSTETSPPLLPADQVPGLDQATLDELGIFIMSIPEMADEGIRPDHLQYEPTITPSALEVEVQQWYGYLDQAAQSIAPSYEGALAYACGLAAGLHLVTTSAVAAHPARLQAQTEELFSAMANLPEDAWDTFEMLHVRILLTALSTARIISQRSWYNAHLTRRLYRLEHDNWTIAKSLTLRLIDMQTAARQPRTQAVRVLVNDVEIVVDPVEAQERGLSIQTSLIGATPEQWPTSTGA
ncbi:hypothetical protein LTR37_013885 [Vermiconidia calcicola]|uniref:Uncharacterized protein n=1 Tax=Vermiconidia calcicola TaxID=1690605 RepID=A0ACC3MWQ5_9PEZI|nr:hypothetical protein LTR37_013885 [Vermiconidia calcicola]